MAEVRKVEVLESILKANDYVANRLKEEWDAAGTCVVNLLSSPGAGKTTLLEATLERWKERHRVLVLVGDLETERDAERVRRLGFPAIQITTGGTCHLEAHMVEQAWNLAPRQEPYDFIFIENIGNLVCPAGYLLGEHLRVVLLSVPEGDDKPQKYPKAFRSAQGFVITKSDLLPYCDFEPELALKDARAVQPELRNFVVSARTGEGVEAWVQYLEERRQSALTVT